MNDSKSFSRAGLRGLVILVTATALAGCSVLIGNVRPVEEPAPLPENEAKSAQDLPVLSAPWRPLDAAATKKEGGTLQAGSLVPELSFQNEETGSTLAYTSGCRKSYQKAPPALRRIAQSLGSGLSRIQKQEHRDTAVSGIPALRSLIQGWAGGSPVIIESILFSKKGCVFDLTLVSLARHHEQDRPAFDKVLATLPLSK
jgi:hypothetical protein